MPPSRKRALSDLCGVGNVSTSGLARILRAVNERGSAGVACSASSVARAVQADLDVSTPYGPCMQQLQLRKSGGGTFDWTACHPAALLTYLCKSAPAFEQFLIEKLETVPCSQARPWDIAVFFDECSPGNLLRTDQTRKSMLLYFGVVSWGVQIMSKENNWLLLGLMRAKQLANIPGRLSGLLNVVLSTWFFGAHSASEVGWTVWTSDGRVLGPIFFRLKFLVGDEDGMRAAWKVKGSSGDILCMFCKNVVRTGSELAEFDDYLHDATETNTGFFDTHTDDSWYACCEKLRRTAARDLAREEMVLGLHYDEAALMFSAPLRRHIGPITSTMLDFSHIWFVHGIFHFELTQFLDATAAALRLRYNSIHDFVQCWMWPASEKNPPKQLFNAAHAASEGGFKAGSSQCLSVYGVVRKFVRTCVPADALLPEKASFFKMCTVVDGWLAYRDGIMQPAHYQLWHDQMAEHLHLFKTAYGKGACKPKHHATLHIKDMLDRFGALQTTMVHERKHKTFKEKAAHVKLAEGFEASLTKQLVNHQANLMCDGKQFRSGHFLEDSRPFQCSDLPEGDWCAGKRAVRDGMKFAKGDMVSYEFQCSVRIAGVELCLHERASNSYFILASLYNRAEDREDVFRHSNTKALLPFSALRGACVWSHARPESKCVLLPGSLVWRS